MPLPRGAEHAVRRGEGGEGGPQATQPAGPSRILMFGFKCSKWWLGTNFTYDFSAEIFESINREHLAGNRFHVQTRARTAAPHCGSHCRPRTATPPLPIALPPRTAYLRFIPHVGLSLHCFQNIGSFHILSGAPGYKLCSRKKGQHGV